MLLHDGDRAFRFAVEWWVGDGLGILVVGSVLLLLRPGARGVVRTVAVVEAVALGVACVLATATVFWLRWPPAAFVLVGLLLVVAFRHGSRAVALVGLATAFVAAQATSEGHAYWEALEISPATGVVYVQAVVGAVVCVALALAAQIGEHERAVAARTHAEAARRAADRSAVRSERLRALAEELSGAATAGAVGEAFLREALGAVGASAGALLLLDAERDGLLTAATLGRRETRWRRRIPCERGWFVAAAVLDGQSVKARVRAEVEQRFPASAANLGEDAQAVVAVPLRAFGSVTGAFGLEFDRELEAGEVDLALLETMASVCAPALERARASDAEAAAHHALSASEARYRATFLHAPVGIAEADMSGRYVRVNPRMCEITGYDEHELLARGYQEITHPDDLEVDVRLSRSVIDGEIDAYTLEKRYIRKDGAVVWVDLEVSASRDGDGAITHLIAVVEDVTGRKEAETALRQSEARFRAVFASIDEGYCLAEMVVDDRGHPVDYRFLEVNPLFGEMTGLDDAVGRTALELVPELERSWIDTYARVALGGETLRFEEGSEAMERWFDVFATPVEPRGRFALVFKDITRRRASERAQQERQAAERRSRRRAELLARVMGELEEVDGLAGRAERLVELIVPRLADHAVVEIPAEDEPVVAIAPRRPDGRPADVGEVHSRAVVPLAVGDLRGTLTLGLADATRAPYTEDDTAFVREVAGRAGTLLASARLREAEHLIAVSLQRALLPDDVLRHPAVSVAARYEAGADVLEVGGDWYDSFELPDGRIGIVVGDVVGHGLEAAATMGRYRTALAALARHTASPARLLSQMEAFAGGPDGCDFATCAYAILDPRSGELTYASAGHPPLLLVRADGDVRWLDDAQSLPLCSLAGDGRPEGSVVLGPDDLLVLYSDGLVERRHELLDLGLDRLRATVTSLRNEPVARLCDALVERMRAQSSGEDDAVVVSVRYTPTTARSFRSVVPARSDALSGLRTALRSWLELSGVPPERHSDVLLLVGEAAANAIEHAYGAERVGVVEVEARLGRETLGLTVLDHGSWRPPGSGHGRGNGTGIMRALSTSFDRRTDAHGTTVDVRIDLDSGVAVEA